MAAGDQYRTTTAHPLQFAAFSDQPCVVQRPTTRTNTGGLVTIRSNPWNASALAPRNPTSTRPKMAAHTGRLVPEQLDRLLEPARHHRDRPVEAKASVEPAARG
jgi:hypothetical protein